ncbi:MAG TPA: hypothetical protein PKC73_01180 [Dermatophilaceae bacterium]|jgi:hypothetical protein|nr:hypothetical protein [Dermatophilaceae bacterium]
MHKIVNHLKNNKKTYITGGVCLVVGAAGAVLLTRNPAEMNVDSKIYQVLAWKPKATLEVYIEALGDPGNIIQDMTTGTIYASQNQAAKELGLNASRISQQLHGKATSVEGHVFQKLGKAQVSQ